MITYFFGRDGRASKVKKITVFYYGEGDSGEATRLANAERAGHNLAKTIDATAFDGEIETCTAVVILASVKSYTRAKIEAVYGGKLIPLRGSPKWHGGEIKTIEHGPEAETTLIIPDEVIVRIPDEVLVSGSKTNPQEVSRAARPDANMASNVSEPTFKPRMKRKAAI